MAFTKYASLEVSKILDVKGSPERDTSASLAKISSFEDYRTQDGYLYARIRAISSRVNKNHDGWPSVELAGSQDIFDHHTSSTGGFTVEASKDAEYGFSTFLGKPIFVDHHNSDPSRARGVIVDAKLHVDDHKTAAQKDSYYRDAPANHTPPTWVELLLEVDAKSFPKLAKAIIDGSRNAKNGIDGFSMGCDVERSVCNICKNSATTPDEFCNHVKMKGAYFDYIDENGHKTSKKSYEDCYGIKFFEISAVFDPADETALIREVRSNVKEASMNKTADVSTITDPSNDPYEMQQRYKDLGVQRNKFYERVVQLAAEKMQMPATYQPQQENFPYILSDLIKNEFPNLPEWILDYKKMTQPNQYFAGGYDQELQNLANEGAKVWSDYIQSNQNQQAQDQGTFVQPNTSTAKEASTQHNSIDRVSPAIGGGTEYEGNITKGLIEFIQSQLQGQTQNLEQIVPQLAQKYLEYYPPEYAQSGQVRKVVQQYLQEPSELINYFRQSGQNAVTAMNKFAPISEYDKYFGGTGAAKKAYDSMIDQYGEEKGKEVFYATMNKKKNKKEAGDVDKPQFTKTRAPEEVDTLREDEVCDICGEIMDGPQCDVCGYEKEPKGFGDPDLTAAKEHDKLEEQESAPEEALSNIDVDTNNLNTVAHVTDTGWTISNEKTAQINKIEKPILPVQTPPASNEPKDYVVKDQKEPVTSSVRTASDFLAAAGNRKRNNMETHIADAETSAPAVAKPDHHTDVEGVGGVGEASNAGASKADAQVNLTDIGGVSGVGTGDEKTVEVTQGDEHSKNIEAIHTDTWHGNEGDSLGQQDPVTDVSTYQVFNSDSFTPIKHHELPATKSSTWVVSDVKGTRPADPVGNPDERIEVSHGDAHTKTTEDSGPTKTWTGTEGNGVTRQADPVDPKNEAFYEHQNSKENHPTDVSDKDYAFGDKSSHLMTAFKLADTEIELGILDASQKYARVAELEKAAPSVVEASLAYANRVKTAGLKKSARTAKRLPSLVREASTAPATTQADSDDSALFM